MADSYVCSGAMMKCTMGTAPAKLTVLPIRTIFLAGQPQANISDHKSMVNLAPFGLCRSLAFPPTAAATAAALGTLTPMPCIHNTPAPWIGGKMDVLLQGQPALLKSCKCQCMWGGTISLVTDGQVGEGTQYLQKMQKNSFSRNSKENKQETTGSNGSKKQLPKKKEPSTPEEIAEYNRKAGIVLKRCLGLSDDEKQRILDMARKMPDNLTNLEKLAIAERNLELEKEFDQPIGERMSVSEADKQNANPNYDPNASAYQPDPEGSFVDNEGNRYRYDPDPEYIYSINCATCSAAYALRLMGFDVKAKGNSNGTLNEEVSIHPFDMWNNVDGSKAQPTRTEKWMEDNNIESMTIEDYKKYFDETCAEEGVYTIALRWSGGGGHATILQRDKDGNLYYIEPQVYESEKTQDGRRSIDDLLISSNGSLKLVSNPSGEEGILRVDDKLLDPKYAVLFET